MDLFRVLVVDDEPGMRSGAALVLERLTFKLQEAEGHEVGFEVDVAESGEVALEKITERAPDILILDYKLPGLSGLDVLSRLSSIAPDLLTIMITAYATLDTAVVATKRGAFDFLAKPFTPDELRSTVLKASKHASLQRQARRHAEEKRRIRFEFVSVLAHELKAPLSAVEGYLLAMQDRSLGLDLEACAPMIERSIVRLRGMRNLVIDLLDLTRIESGQRKREIERLDLVELAKAALENVRADAEEKKLTLELDAQGPALMMGDRGEIELVLNNSLTNAIKFNREGGSVKLHVELSGERVTLRVQDTGIGMTKEEAGRLFKEFVRIKNEKTRMIPGSGLGLSTVRKVALLYNGDAKIESEPGVGTTLEVVLNSIK